MGKQKKEGLAILYKELRLYSNYNNDIVSYMFWLIYTFFNGITTYMRFQLFSL